jgi:phosphoglycolate phosphatase
MAARTTAKRPILIQPLPLAVFDVDGTLIDSQHAIVAAMTAACGEIGIATPSPANIRRIIGLSLTDAVTLLLPDIGPGVRDALVDAYKRDFARQRGLADHHEPLFEGARAALDALSAAGWLLAVATGKSRRGLAAMLERHGLSGRFVSLQTADDNPGKPHPGMLRRAIAEAGAQAAATVMIGDTSYDMQMGRAAGTRTLGVAWGNHRPADLLDAGAERVVERYDQLPDSVTRLLAPP